MSHREWALILLAWILVGAFVYIRVPQIKNLKIDPIILQGKTETKEVVKEVVKEVCTDQQILNSLDGVFTEIVKHKKVTINNSGKSYIYQLQQIKELKK